MHSAIKCEGKRRDREEVAESAAPILSVIIFTLQLRFPEKAETKEVPPLPNTVTNVVAPSARDTARRERPLNSCNSQWSSTHVSTESF